MSWIFSVDGNYVNFNGGANLYRLHKDSNCIGWHFDETGDLFFDVYDQQYSVKAENIGTVIINGVPLSAASDFGDAIIAVFPGLGGSSSPGGSSYLVLQSPDETLWSIGVNDEGALQTTQIAEGEPGELHLFSPDNTEWNVTVTDDGALITTEI